MSPSKATLILMIQIHSPERMSKPD